MKFNITKDGDEWIVHLQGDVREGAGPTLKDLLKALPMGPVTFNCVSLGTFNSPGIKTWTAFVTQASESSKITFAHMPAVMLDLALIVRQFLGSGRIRSLVVPFSCQTCNKTTYQTCAAANGAKDLSTKACGTCGQKADAEVDIEEVSAFLKGLAS